MQRAGTGCRLRRRRYTVEATAARKHTKLYRARLPPLSYPLVPRTKRRNLAASQRDLLMGMSPEDKEGALQSRAVAHLTTLHLLLASGDAETVDQWMFGMPTGSENK